MFTRFRKQGYNDNTLIELKTNRTSQKSYAQRNTLTKKTKNSQIRYSQIHKKNIQTQSHVLSHSIIQSQKFVFEGSCNRYQKNGQGIMFMKNGNMIIGTWIRDKITGKALIFTSFGGIISANFIDGKLNGWTISLYKNKLIMATLYFEDKIDGQRIIFESNQSIWVASKFSPEGKFLKITHAQNGQRYKLPSFIDSEELCDFFTDFCLNRNYLGSLKNIHEIQISPGTLYLGFVDENYLPKGLGVTFSEKQTFLGNYNEGYLNEFGRMIFQNGQIYQGHILNGQFHRQGIYYNPLTNTTILLDSHQEVDQKILQQFEGYTLLDFSIGLGSKIENKDEGIMGGIWLICQNLQKYYQQNFIERQMQEKNQYSIKQNPSQNFGEFEDDQKMVMNQNFIEKAYSIPKLGWVEDEMAGNSDFEYDDKNVVINDETSREINAKQPIMVKNKQKYKINNYESLVIQQNITPTQSQNFNKGSPKKLGKKKMFDIITISQTNENTNFNMNYQKQKNKKQSLESRSLEIYNLSPTLSNKNNKNINRMNTHKNTTNIGFKKQYRRQEISESNKVSSSSDMNYINNHNYSQINQDSDSSQISQISQKMNNMVKRTMSKRKKIFS